MAIQDRSLAVGTRLVGKYEGTEHRAEVVTGKEGKPRYRCFWHSPEHADEAAEARRLGGLRRRREATLAGAYEVEGLHTLPNIRRLLEIAALDALGLDNSIARSRALAYLAQVAVKLLEVGELEARLAAVEAAVQPIVQAVRPTR